MAKQNVLGKIEAVLFVAGRPLSYKALAQSADCKPEEAAQAVAELNKRYEAQASGIRCVVASEKVQLYSASEYDELVATFLQAEEKTELSKPSIETLTIIAYRGPISKEELEHIRGINCSLILRNLLIRGLVQDSEKGGAKYYEVTHDFISNLGCSSVEELPDYEALRHHENIERVVANMEVLESDKQEEKVAESIEIE